MLTVEASVAWVFGRFACSISYLCPTHATKAAGYAMMSSCMWSPRLWWDATQPVCEADVYMIMCCVLLLFCRHKVPLASLVALPQVYCHGKCDHLLFFWIFHCRGGASGGEGCIGWKNACSDRGQVVGWLVLCSHDITWPSLPICRGHPWIFLSALGADSCAANLVVVLDPFCIWRVGEGMVNPLSCPGQVLKQPEKWMNQLNCLALIKVFLSVLSICHLLYVRVQGQNAQ